MERPARIRFVSSSAVFLRRRTCGRAPSPRIVHGPVMKLCYARNFLSQQAKMQKENQVLPQQLIEQLIVPLNLLRSEMLQLEASGLAASSSVHPDHRASAANLIHYLALRMHDIRQLQAQLASLGLSSLGRTEQHVIGGLDAVMKIL